MKSNFIALRYQGRGPEVSLWDAQEKIGSADTWAALAASTKCPQLIEQTAFKLVERGYTFYTGNLDNLLASNYIPNPGAALGGSGNGNQPSR